MTPRLAVYLDVDDVLEIFDALIGPPQRLLRSRELLESAVLLPRQSAFGRDAYPTLGRKAWAYLRGLAQNHAFVDGNKRIAWATMRAFLLANGIGIRAPVEIAENLVVGVASGALADADVLAFLETYGEIVTPTKPHGER